MILRWSGIQQVMALDDPRLHTAHLWILPVPRPARTFVVILIHLANRLSLFQNLITILYYKITLFYIRTTHDILRLLRNHQLFIKTARSLRKERPTLIQHRFFDEAIRAKRRKWIQSERRGERTNKVLRRFFCHDQRDVKDSRNVQEKPWRCISNNLFI